MVSQFNSSQPFASAAWFANLEDEVGKWPFCLLLTLTVQIISFFFYPGFPAQDMTKLLRYQSIIQLSENPFTSEPLAEPTVRHRILVPLLAWILHLHGSAYIVLIFVGNFLFLLLTALLLRQSLPPLLTAMTTMLLGTTLAVITSQNWLTVQDCFAYAALVGCLLLRTKKWTIGPLLFVGMLADERCLAAVPLLLIWCQAVDTPGDSPHDRSHRLLYALLATAAFAMVYFLLHHFATTPPPTYRFAGFDNQTDFVTNTLQGRVLIAHLPYIPAGLWFSLRAAWLVPLFLAWQFQKKTSFVVFFVLGILATALPAMLVNDISRVASLGFLSVLMAVVLLYREQPTWTYYLVKIALIVNLMSPQLQIHAPNISLITPLPFALVNP
jgi:hypothetical protein